MEEHIVKIKSIHKITHDVLQIVTEKPNQYIFTPGQATEVSINKRTTLMDIAFNLNSFFNSLIYSLLGVAVFWISFIVIDKITPYDLWGEICRERNVALAIVVGAMCLGISLIVASAIH